MTASTSVSSELESGLKRASVAVGCVLIVLSVLNLLGWAVGIDWLKPPFLGIISMKVSAALCFLVGGLCLVLRQSPYKQLRHLAVLLATIILASVVFVFFSHVGNSGTVDAQYVSPAVCVLFMFAAIGLILAEKGKQDLPAILVITTGSLGFFTRVFGIRIFHEHYGYMQGIGVDTYLSFLACSMLAVFGLGILISNPRTALYGLLCSTTRGGYITRRIIPIAILVPMAWAAATTAGEFAHLYNQPLRWTLFVNGTILSFCLLCCYIAQRLDAIDKSRIVLAEKRADVVYSLAHDLKVPIIGATQSLDLLLKEALGQLQTQQRSLLSVLRDSLNDQLWMIENLVYEYKTEEGKEVISPGMCFVDKLLDDCLEKIMPAFKAKSLEVKVIHAHPEVSILADSVALRRVINNLLHNALKHSPRNGQVEVRSGAEDKTFNFSIWNSGPVISDAQISHLFERFWQSEDGHTRHIGNGLGLYICRQIVDAHKGEISCQSKQGEGTAFTVCLPREKTEP